MAYAGHEFTNTAGTRAAIFAAMQAFLVDVGWELHDAVSATVEVYRSNGESGKEPYGYLWIDAGTSTYIQFAAYQYWNATTHTGVRLRYAVNDSITRILTATLTSTASKWIFAGDKNFVGFFFAPATNSSNLGVGCGHIPGRVSPDLATAMGTAGTPGTLLVDSSSKFGAGKTITICGAEGVDKLAVTSAPSSSTVVVTALPRNYGTGAVIGSPASVFGLIVKDQNYYTNFYPTSFYSDAGTTVSATVHAVSPVTAPNITSVLMHYNGLQYAAPIPIFSVSATSPGILLGMFFSGFLHFRSGLAGGDCMLANADDSISPVGAATSGSSTTLVDSSKSWVDDSQIGRFVVITAGAGAAQICKITDNDGTTLTVDAWDVNPNATSEYKICDYVYRIFAALMTAVGGPKTGILITHTTIPA